MSMALPSRILLRCVLPTLALPLLTGLCANLAPLSIWAILPPMVLATWICRNGLVFLREHRQEVEAAREETRLAQQQLKTLHTAIEALPLTFELWSPEQRLVLCNSKLHAEYPHLSHLLKPGVPVRQVLEASLEVELIPEARQDPAAWIDERMRQRGRSDAPLIQEHQGQWRKILERRTSDDHVVAIRMDVTDVVQNERRVQQMEEQARMTRRQLDEAIQSMSQGFALFDPRHRLIVCNEAFNALYKAPESGLEAGMPFESLMRQALNRGDFPGVTQDIKTWLAQTVTRHSEGQGPALLERGAGRWFLIESHRTRSGCTTRLETDVTELVLKGRQLNELERKLASAETRCDWLFQTSPSPWLILNRDGMILQANAAAHRLLGHVPPDLEQRPVAEVLPQLDMALLEPSLPRDPVRESERADTGHQGDGLRLTAKPRQGQSRQVLLYPLEQLSLREGQWLCSLQLLDVSPSHSTADRTSGLAQPPAWTAESSLVRH